MSSGADAGARRRLFPLAARSHGRSPLRAARFEGRWVVLDVARGEYLALPDLGADLGPELDDANRSYAPADSPNSVDALRRALARAGSAEREVALVAPPPDPVSEEQPPLRRHRPSASDVAVMAFALALTAWDLKRPFAVLVRPRQPPRRTCGDDEALRQSQLFAQLLVWSPWQGRCLFRSRWLLRYLQLQGCAADWVFGVRGWPFQAHCWVRRGGVLLNEPSGAVRAYREIAVF